MSRAGFTLLYTKHRAASVDADSEAVATVLAARLQVQAAAASKIESMFCALDVDQDGFLRKDEYRAFLVRIGMWGEARYTDAGWDARWPAELASLGCDLAGVSRAGFTMLYTKHRAAKLDAESTAVAATN